MKSGVFIDYDTFCRCYAAFQQLTPASPPPQTCDDDVSIAPEANEDENQLYLQAKPRSVAETEVFGVAIRKVFGAMDDLSELFKLYEDLQCFINGKDEDDDDDHRHHHNRVLSTEEEKQPQLKNKIKLAIARLDSTTAVEAHHEYYDHAARAVSLSLPLNDSLAESLQRCGFPHPKSGLVSQSSYELAAIHAQLGNTKEAFLAAREAVCVAQHCNDSVRLALSLDLLKRLDIKQQEFLKPKSLPCTVANFDPVAEPSIVFTESSLRPVLNFTRSDFWESFGHASLSLVWTKCVYNEAADSDLDDDVEIDAGADVDADQQLDDALAESAIRLALARHALGCKVDHFLLGASLELSQHEFKFDGLPPSLSFLYRQTTGKAWSTGARTKILETTFALSHSVLINQENFCGARRVRELTFTAGLEKLYDLLEIDAHCAMKNYASAYVKMTADDSPSCSRIEIAVKNLRIARLFQGERALMFALKASSDARETNARTLTAAALAEVARAHLELGTPHQALELVREALPQLSAHAPLHEYFKARIVEIKCEFALLGSSSSGAESSSSTTTRASLQRLQNECLIEFQEIELAILREIMFLIAENTTNPKEREDLSEHFFEYQARVKSESKQVENKCIELILQAVDDVARW